MLLYPSSCSKSPQKVSGILDTARPGIVPTGSGRPQQAPRLQFHEVQQWQQLQMQRQLQQVRQTPTVYTKRRFGPSLVIPDLSNDETRLRNTILRLVKSLKSCTGGISGTPSHPVLTWPSSVARVADIRVSPLVSRNRMLSMDDNSLNTTYCSSSKCGEENDLQTQQSIICMSVHPP